jgi:carbon storage regulator
MLVIRRRKGEAFLIGENVEIEILEIEGGQVKIGIAAPREVTVLRKEIATIREANREAAQPSAELGLEETLRRLRERKP